VSQKWKEVKQLREKQIKGKKCEICGTEKGNIIGHHLISKTKKMAERAELCELRCEECERIMHKTHKEGNGYEQKIRIEKYILQ